ncbi:MAG TPA: hypothetical protein VFJ48_01240 [Casimicrobiaceae bacterium]|nr:hypothetical protein [Casimicrobiaceae bacterium]
MAHADTHEWRVKTRPHPPLNWSAALWASVISGLVFAALEMALVPVFEGLSPWLPLHLIAAIGLGPDALSPANNFDLRIVSTAVAIHMGLAILYGMILALIIVRLDAGWAIVVGCVYGLVLYYINFYGFTRAFPWFADARGGVSALTHIVQSGLMALLYKLFARRSRA